MDKSTLNRLIVVVPICILLIVVGAVFTNSITAKRDIEVRKLEQAEEAQRQLQKTERTEERSQFWQKMVPYGDDEAEENVNAAATDSVTP